MPWPKVLLGICSTKRLVPLTTIHPNASFFLLENMIRCVCRWTISNGLEKSVVWIFFFQWIFPSFSGKVYPMIWLNHAPDGLHTGHSHGPGSQMVSWCSHHFPKKGRMDGFKKSDWVWDGRNEGTPDMDGCKQQPQKSNLLPNGPLLTYVPYLEFVSLEGRKLNLNFGPFGSSSSGHQFMSIYEYLWVSKN